MFEDKTKDAIRYLEEKTAEMNLYLSRTYGPKKFVVSTAAITDGFKVITATPIPDVELTKQFFQLVVDSVKEDNKAEEDLRHKAVFDGKD